MGVTDTDTARFAEAPRCPLVGGQRFDPLDPEQAGDPFPWLLTAQQEAPVFYLDELDIWCVTRYEDVLEVIKDTDTYSSANNVQVVLAPEVAAEHPEGHPLSAGMVNLDPPVHTRLRRLSQKAFTPKMIAAREPEIRAICDELVDAFVADGCCDLVAQFSTKLPILAVTKIVGAPAEKADEFNAWHEEGARMTENAPPLDPAERLRLSERAVAFSKWFTEFIEERRARPQADLTSALLHAELDDGTPALSTNEVIAVIANILAAGTGTTANFLPILVRDVLRDERLCAELQRDRSLIVPAVEEALRLDTPVRGVRRLVTRDTELGGVAIPEGASVYIHYGASQRDPSVFENPQDFDLHRANLNQHYAFGRWTHICLGAPLVRLEARITLECLFDRLPGVRLRPGQEIRWQPNLISPVVDHMYCEWDAPAGVGA